VAVRHEDGSVTLMKVPRSMKQMKESLQRDKWLGADQAALDAILANPRNRLVPETKPNHASQAIAPCVTTRLLKVDKDTMKLAAKNAFKSRHAFDHPR
jgi:hypothetical protein